jgi:hypothetical protein
MTPRHDSVSTTSWCRSPLPPFTGPRSRIRQYRPLLMRAQRVCANRPMRASLHRKARQSTLDTVIRARRERHPPHSPDLRISGPLPLSNEVFRRNTKRYFDLHQSLDGDRPVSYLRRAPGGGGDNRPSRSPAKRRRNCEPGVQMRTRELCRKTVQYKTVLQVTCMCAKLVPESCRYRDRHASSTPIGRQVSND